MPDYTQDNRPLRVDTPLPTDTLLLNGFNGIEGLSELFTFQLDLVSTDANVDPAALVGEPMLTTLELTGGGKRFFHGIVSRLAHLGKRDELFFYRAEIVPAFWRLTLTRESRMYQDLSVPDILQQVFERTGLTDFEFRLTHEYAPREYCVQYRETHFNFVSRLLEEEGIGYFFEHFEDKHVLVVCDDNGSTTAAPEADSVRFLPEQRIHEDSIHEFENELALRTGKVTIWNYDFLQPTLKLAATLGEKLEHYDYPVNYTDPEQGDKMARLLLEAEEAARLVARGASTVRGLIPGHFFTLKDHFRSDANTKYLITQVQHYARMGGYRAWDQGAEFDYRNDFLAIPFDTPYRPPRRTPRPVIRGWQPAIVTGPPGEEVHVDKYGRVKVQFYWDRDGKRDEKTSCWIRVVTPWGGKGYGSVSIPRIGNEVVVAFQEGDPDLPLIIGSVFNDDQMPPFTLPGAGIQMGMKSRSSPGGGGMNEITMTDTKGKEMMNVHAQYDLVTTIQHDETHTVKTGNRKIAVETGTHTEEIKGDTSITITSGTYKLDVAAKTHTHHVKGDVKEDYDAKQNTTVVGDVTETYKANQKTTCSHNITIDAGDQITLVSGSSKITLEKSGKITIQGKEISIIGDDSVKISGKVLEATAGNEAKFGVGNQQITCDKTKVNTSGAAINSSAVGMHEITGALVKIN